MSERTCQFDSDFAHKKDDPDGHLFLLLFQEIEEALNVKVIAAGTGEAGAVWGKDEVVGLGVYAKLLYGYAGIDSAYIF